MARNGGGLVFGAVHEDRMSGALTQELAAAALEVPKEIYALHAERRKRSRMTEALASSSSASSRFA